MPKRTRSHELEDQSRNKLREAFINHGWTVEDLTKDYGEDLLVRIFSGGLATPLSFFVQAKATDNIDKYIDSTRAILRYPVSSAHFEHWERFWEPVILTLWDPKSGVTYWECIQSFYEDLLRRPARKQYMKTLRVEIPIDNRLDKEGLTRIEVRTRSRFERFTREKDGAETLIRELKEALGLQLEYDPQFGVLIIPKGSFVMDPAGGKQALFFGRAAEYFKRFEKQYGISPEQAFHQSIDLLGQISDVFSAGGKLGMRDAAGNILQSWDTLEKFNRHVHRASEIDEEKD